MKIGVFTYNFKHWKTQQGVFNLIMSNMKPEVMIAAEPVKLNFDTPPSKLRVSQKDLYLHHPKDIAERFDINYYVSKHNSEQTKQIIELYDLAKLSNSL